MSKDELVKLLRLEGYMTYADRKEAADLIDQQAARIVALEAQIAPVAPAVAAQPAAIQAGDDVTVTNVPARIYLNLGDLYEMGEIPFQSLTDVTWCEDRIDDADIEYVRACASAQSEGLRKDAERYRWLRNDGFVPADFEKQIDAALSKHTGEKS